jgi:regulatory protein YycI of two-component signal transduction system YycFG
VDWRRAKTILIWAFLLLDCFLAFQVWASHGEIELAQQTEGAADSLQDFVKSRGIVLSTQLPVQTPSMYNLNIKYDNFSEIDKNRYSSQSMQVSGNVLNSQFHGPIPAVSLMSKEELLKQLEDAIPFLGEYKPDSASSDPGKLGLVQQWGTYPLFNGELDLIMTDNRLVGYRQTHLTVVKKGSGKKIISSATALRTLIDNHLVKNGEEIHSIDLGYYGHAFDAEIQVVAPVWRIIHGNRQVHYVNGFTGVIEKTSPLQKKD